VELSRGGILAAGGGECLGPTSPVERKHIVRLHLAGATFHRRRPRQTLCTATIWSVDGGPGRFRSGSGGCECASTTHLGPNLPLSSVSESAGVQPFTLPPGTSCRRDSGHPGRFPHASNRRVRRRHTRKPPVTRLASRAQCFRVIQSSAPSSSSKEWMWRGPTPDTARPDRRLAASEFRRHVSTA